MTKINGLLLALLLVVGSFFCSTDVNQPSPAPYKALRVDAGPDTTIKLVSTFSLPATVADDSVPVDSVKITWRQVFPVVDSLQATIFDTAFLTSRTQFPDTGVYAFQVMARDAARSDTDTIVVTVIPNLPFLVLAPAEGEKVRIGEPYTIRWQIDPDRAVWVELSLDDGLTFPTKLTASSIQAGTTSLVWDVDAAIADSTHAVIRVNKYNTNVFATRSILLVKNL